MSALCNWGVCLFAILYICTPHGIAQTGRVGVNTVSPLASFHVQDSSVLFSGPAIPPVLPGPPPVSGPGIRLMWYPGKAAFRAGWVAGPNWDIDSVGVYSIAAGYNPKAKGLSSVSFGFSSFASGHYSTAFGDSTIATGLISTAFGNRTKASGHSSFAFGNYSVASGHSSMAAGIGTIASGWHSASLGHYTQAHGYASLVVGLNNDTIVPPQSAYTSTTPLFIIGNGNSPSFPSNALVVRKDGRMGLGVNAPAARLHVQDSSVLFSGAVLPQDPGPPPVSGQGIRLMWYADKAAFRAGYVSGSQWNMENVGIYSFAFGLDVTASGDRSTAFGWNTEADGVLATAFGSFTNASGTLATAFGYNTTASGNESTAFGWITTASAHLSTAAGKNTKAHGYASFVIGTFNDTIVSPQNSVTNETPLFIIGNGTNYGSTSNAMVVRKDGRTGIGTNAPLERLHLHNDAGNVAFRVSSSDGDTAALKIFEGSGFGFEFQYDGIGDQLHLWSRQFSGNEDIRMTWKKNGDIGIGTTAPNNKLDIRSDGIVNTPEILLGLISNTSNRPVIQFSEGTVADPTSGMSIEYDGSGGSSENKLNFRGTDALPKVTILNTGRVGIATASPERELSIFDIGANGDALIALETTTGGAKEMLLGFNQSTGGILGMVTATNLTFRTSNTTRMTITSTGNVGIGTSAPSEKLHVAGNICYTGAIAACSDVRYKTDFHSLRGVLSKLEGIDVYTYAWRSDAFPDREFSKDPQIGVIAQEVQTVFPEIVLTDSDGYLSVDYSRLSVILLAALKEQQSEIAELKTEIEKIKQK